VAAQLWPALVLAQAQVEPVPEPPPAFDMWNLDALENPPIALPGEPVTPPPVSVDGSDPDAPPPATSSNTADPCRHFTPEERRLLPTLCGGTD
jgi:hypothetical protein